MHPPRFLAFLAAALLAVSAPAQTPAEGRALDDFSNYQLGELIAGRGANSPWRAGGKDLARYGQIVAVNGEHVLGLTKQKIAIFDAPGAFLIPADGSGSLSFRIRLPSEGAKENDAFHLILKTRDQAEADLTNPTNGLNLLQFSYAAAESAYRFRLEGPGPSPTPALLAPDRWHHVTVRFNLPLAYFQVLFAPDAGASPTLVTNHLYRDGIIPFKNRATGDAEIIYLRNHSINGQVEFDALRFTPGK